MSKVGIRALKQNASAVVAEAAAGESVTITDRGRPVAQLTPIPTSTLKARLAAGHGRPSTRAIADLPSPRRGPALSPVLIAQRNAERW